MLIPRALFAPFGVKERGKRPVGMLDFGSESENNDAKERDDILLTMTQ